MFPVLTRKKSNFVCIAVFLIKATYIQNDGVVCNLQTNTLIRQNNSSTRLQRLVIIVTCSRCLRTLTNIVLCHQLTGLTQQGRINLDILGKLVLSHKDKERALVKTSY